MAKQTLYIDGRTMQIDRLFRDSNPGRPVVAMVGTRFVYLDGKEVTKEEDLAVVPAQYRSAKTAEAPKTAASGSSAFVCEAPGCGKSFKVKVAYLGHLRSHEKK